jgi:lysophospholipase L1-like esterase
MKTYLRSFISLTLALGILALSGQVQGQAQKSNRAIQPMPRGDTAREKGWHDRHHKFLEIAKKGEVEVLFLGDSITQGWEGAGKGVWKERFEPLKTANFGIGGDQTQHVLWRLREGKELHGISPKVVVLMIGTNNTHGNSAEEIAEGITAIVEEIKHELPHGKVLLLGIFPRGEKPSNTYRAKIKDVNERIAKLDDAKTVRYLDIGEKFLQSDGTLSKDIMPDFLHLTPKGYQIWADAIQPTLTEMLK